MPGSTVSMLRRQTQSGLLKVANDSIVKARDLLAKRPGCCAHFVSILGTAGWYIRRLGSTCSQLSPSL
jgi:hypothetical protein